ncbi:hypothetical protein EH223_01730 [candidate division KSB1 bacterium]|nr:hypothetical protein [candidate division KSB1 bacterium]RQW06917.1 MAG: hypothetical protein EH223_01730 [candidate division KSB1 bacterium]
MRTNLGVFILLGLFIFADATWAQVPERKYAWQKQDTLKIVYKDVLNNDNYNAQKLDWNKKRVIGTALMLGFGALTYYYHQRAESSYSSYLNSGSISQMDAHFKRTEKFDKLKGLAGIGVEIGFLLNVWSFF